MTPIHFSGENCIYKSTGPDIEDLPALRENGNVTSRWRPTYAELQALVAGGSVELTVMGGQPAVALRVV